MTEKVEESKQPEGGEKPGPTKVKKEKRKNLRHSNFFITINTNKRFPSTKTPEFKELSEKFEQCINEIFERKFLQSLILLQDPEANHGPKFIKNISAEGEFEIAPQTKCLHYHGMIRIDHWTNVKLNYERLRAKVKADLGLENLHFHCQVFRDNTTTLRDYINKGKKAKTE